MSILTHSLLVGQTSAQALQDLKRRRLEFRKEGNTLIDFFCEDKDNFKLDECFRIFQDFCLKFKKAVQVDHTRVSLASVSLGGLYCLGIWTVSSDQLFLN